MLILTLAVMPLIFLIKPPVASTAADPQAVID
jgi:hypothetical protein